MKNRKKVVLACSIVFVIIVSTATYVAINAANSASTAKQIGHSISEVIDKTEEKIVAKVGKHEITNRDIEMYKMSLMFYRLYLNLANPEAEVEDMTVDQIIQDLANNFILYSEAEKLGLVVSDDMVNSYIENQKKLFNEVDPDEATLFENFAKGLGLSINQYYDLLTPVYKRELSIGNLRAKYIAEDMTFDQQVLVWQQKRESIISQNQSMIEIIN